MQTTIKTDYRLWHDNPLTVRYSFSRDDRALPFPVRARNLPGFGVSVLDQASVQRDAGLDRWQDDRLWHTARQHPSPAALPALAELQMAHVRAVSGLSKKVAWERAGELLGLLG